MPSNARACNACWLRAHRQPPPAESGSGLFVISTARTDNEDSLQEPNPIISGSSSVVEPPSSASTDTENVLREPVVRLTLDGYSRTPDTTIHCFVPDCMNHERKRVPLYLKKNILTHQKLYITQNARVCEEHLSLYNWDFLAEFEFVNEFNQVHITEMLDLLRRDVNNTIDFENVEHMNNTTCRYWTGLTVLNFLAILTCIPQLSNICKKPKTALGMYLIKIRTGEPFRRIASLFRLSTYTVCQYVKKTRGCLLESYVPLHLGISNIPRASLSSRNLLIPQGLFGTQESNPIVIFDGTYIYLQKSSNYLFQKKTYSLHKYANLLKPFMMATTDGFILDVYGPYAATTSDAEIMNQLFAPSGALRNYFRENDVFLLDRGFRDALGLLTSLGFSVHKPETLDVGETQLSTIKANKSRLVTMCRWVIEVVNGRFKRDFKMFRNKYFNVASRNLMSDFRICAAILNNFHPLITDRSDAQAILDRAMQRLNLPNYLGDYVLDHQLNRRRASFIRIDDARLPQINIFPVMEMSDLILFSLGVYQIKQARSYYGEHIRANGTFSVEISESLEITDVPGITSSHQTVLLRGRIRSRHQSNKVYYTYVLINLVESNNWQERISGYYCSCIIGKRTVGSCAHVMTIIWYLGWARHQNNILPPAQFLDNVIVREDVENEEVE